MADGIKIGSLDVSYFKVGSDDCKVYLGDTLLYPTTPPTPSYDQQYLTFVAEESGIFKFSDNSISYSLDSGSTWTSLASDTSTPTVSAGSKIMWKATITPTSKGIGKFSSTGNFTAEGNIMSLLYGDDFEDKVSLQGKSNAFRNLFSGCTGMTSAENLQLPATTLADYCYINMFRTCTSLTTAPQLPATKLETACYQYMFRTCGNLNRIICLATDISASNCTTNWVSGVASSGTFIKAASMSSWTIGIRGIPSNWTVLDYSS